MGMRYCFLLATVITICISSPASAQWTEIGQLEDERMNMIVLEGPEENMPENLANRLEK